MNNPKSLRTDRYYSTKELAKLFRANESTVRRWADAGKLKCFKSPGGHRKFTPEHVSEFINKYHYEIMSFDLDLSHRLGKEMLSFVTKENVHILSEVFFAQAIRADKESLINILRTCYSADIPLDSIYDDIVGTAVRKTLSFRSHEKLSWAQEHLAISSILESLSQFQSFTEKGLPTSQIALCGSPTNGFQEVVLLGLSHLLKVAGWKVYNLGSNTPLEVLIKATQEIAPTLIYASVEYLLENGSQNNCLKLEAAAESTGAELLYFNFYTGGLDVPERNVVGNSTKIASSFKELLPYAGKRLRSVVNRGQNLVAASNKKGAVERVNASKA